MRTVRECEAVLISMRYSHFRCCDSVILLLIVMFAMCWQGKKCMGITTTWYNAEQTIVLEKFDADFSSDDYVSMVRQAREMLLSRNEWVHVMVDFSGVKHIPRSINPMNMMREVKAAHPANQGIVVYVNATMLVDTMVSIAKNIGMEAAAHVHNAKSIEEALHIIEREAPKLPPIA